MRALEWNCRGVNSEDSLTIPYLRWLVLKTNPDFLFLSKTKCPVSGLISVFNKLGCKGCTGVDALNASGGLFVTWFSTNLLVTPEECSQNFSLCNIVDGPYSYYLCFVYGAPRHENREGVWDSLNKIIDRKQGPLIILGDFNQIEFKDKKCGGSRVIVGAKKFTERRVGNGLFELPSHRPAFTWCNNREGGDTIYEQLDRAYWPEELGPLQAALKQEHCGDMEVAKRHEIQEKAKFQHLYWKQRTKLAWNRLGDQSTKLFFRSVKVRKGRNWINSIKEEDGTWIYEEEAVARQFHSYFQKLFTPNNDRLGLGFGETTDNLVLSTHASPQEEESKSWRWGDNIQEQNILMIDGSWKEMESGEVRAAYGWVMEQGSSHMQEGANRIFAASPL
ncbi:hypothetical protein RDABS01_017087 [Bienertia sinuspersici]